jgi:DNA-binding MarR family transcriptional regulator
MPTGHELAMSLRAAYLVMHRRTDDALDSHGVTADQFVLMALLAQADAMTQRDLARRASSDPNTVRAMLLLLERQGLVARRKHRTDARARTVSLTAKGRRAQERLWAASDTIRQELLATLSPGEAESLFGLLGRVVSAMEKAAAEQIKE